MKKAISFVLAAVLISMMAAGCQKQEVQKETSESTKEVQEEASESMKEVQEEASESMKEAQEETSEDTKEAQEEMSESTKEVQETESILVYYPNETADGLLTEETEVPGITPDALMDALTAKAVVTEDCKVLSCEKVQYEGENALDLDLNVEFRSLIQSLGTAGEYTVLGSICNTFLDAYDCQKIRFTIEGGILETGHKEYPGYLSRFE